MNSKTLKILDEDNLGSYPKILIPDFIKKTKNLQFTFNDIYPNYSFPTAPSQPPEDDKSIQDLKNFFGCGLIGFFGLFFGTFFIFILFGEDHISVIGRIIMIGSSILVGIIGAIWFRKTDNKERKLIKENYDRAREKYQIELNDFQKLKKIIISPEFTKAERQSRLAKKFKDTKKDILKSSQILRDDEIKKGPSEEFYYKYLKKYTDYQIYKSLKFGYYYPDLVIIKDNVVIDLEIDEPYTLSNKEPIHYDNVDEGRDKFFLDNEFVVIHFSEDQILKDPKFCAEIIGDIIEICTKLIEKEKSERYQEFETPTWTHEMAFDLAYNSTRDKIVSRIATLEMKFNL